MWLWLRDELGTFCFRPGVCVGLRIVPDEGIQVAILHRHMSLRVRILDRKLGMGKGTPELIPKELR